MADDEEEIIEVKIDGGDESGSLSDADAAAELNRQFEELKADNAKRREAESAALRRAAEAERSASASRQDARAARDEAVSSQSDTIASGLAAAQAEAGQAEADYAAAMEKGDFTGAAKAQRRLAGAVADEKRLTEAKVALETRKGSARSDDDVPSRVASDPFEDHLTKFTPRTADWMRSHRDWVMDPRKSAKLTGAHHMAVGDGYTPDTDEYFDYVEKTLGLREQPQAKQTNGSTNGTGRRSASPPVAPVSGSAGGHSSGSGNGSVPTVTLSKRERDAAMDGTQVWNAGNRHPKTGEPIKHGDPLVGKPIGVQEFARRKLAMSKDGYYDKMYSES